MPQDTVGLALPAIRLNGGYFADRDALDTAFGDLTLALMCPEGGRVMRRGFGGGLDSFLFAPLDSTTQSAIQSLVAQTAKTWVPSVSIIKVVTKASNQTLDVSITFALSSDSSNTRTKILAVPRRQAIQFLSSRSH